MLTINGRLHLRRTRWHDHEQGSETPSDVWLDAAEATISEGVCEMACRLNQSASSFEAAADNLARAAHIELNKESLRQLVEGAAKDVQRQMQRAQLSPEWSADDCKTEQDTTRVYAGCDGVKVPLITAEEKQKRRAKIKSNAGCEAANVSRCRAPSRAPTAPIKTSRWAICTTKPRSTAMWAWPPATMKRPDEC